MKLKTMQRLVNDNLITHEALTKANEDHTKRPKGMRHDDCTWCLKVLPLVKSLQKGQE